MSYAPSLQSSYGSVEPQGPFTVIKRTTLKLPSGRTVPRVFYEAPDGDEGIYVTLLVMKELALRDSNDDEIQKVVRKYTGSTPLETAKKLFHFVVKNYPYISDPEDREAVTAPWATLTKESELYRDCDDLSTLYSCLLTAAGIKNAFKIISWRKTNPPKQYTHVYNEVYLNGSWMPVDVVMRSNGWNNERDGIKRSDRYVVLSTQNLNDSSNVAYDPNINWQAIGKDILERSLPQPIGNGEDIAQVIQGHFLSICVNGVKYQLYQNRYKIALAAALGMAVSFSLGALATVLLQKSRNKKRTHMNAKRSYVKL